MKRLFSFIMAAALIGGAALSCDKGGDDNGKDDPVKARIAAYAEMYPVYGGGDVYKFTYNAEGKMTKVDRVWRTSETGVEEPDRSWEFAYSGNTVTVSGRNEATFTLGANGYVSQAVSGGNTFDYTYNAAGFLTQIKKNDVVVSNQVILDDCIVSWSRFPDGVEELKNQSYSSVKNTAGLHTIYNDKADEGGFLYLRMLYEAGFFGRTSAYMASSSGWSGGTIATYTYDYDDNGLPIAEHKNYGGDLEEFEFEWEILD